MHGKASWYMSFSFKGDTEFLQLLFGLWSKCLDLQLRPIPADSNDIGEDAERLWKMSWYRHTTIKPIKAENVYIFLGYILR